MKNDILGDAEPFHGELLCVGIESQGTELTLGFLTYLDPFAFLSLRLWINFLLVNGEIIIIAQLKITTQFDFAGNRSGWNGFFSDRGNRWPLLGIAGPRGLKGRFTLSPSGYGQQREKTH